MTVFPTTQLPAARFSMCDLC